MDSEITAKLAGQLESLERSLADYRTSGDTRLLAEFSRTLEDTADAIGNEELAGLQDVLLLLQQNIQDQVSDDIRLSDQQQDTLESGLHSIREYISTPDNPSRTERLLDLVKHSCWQSPLSENDAVLLRDMLLLGSEPRPEAAENEPADQQAPEPSGHFARIRQMHDLQTDPGEPAEQNASLSSVLTEFADELGDNEQFLFQDLCLFLNENFIELQARNESLDDAQGTLLSSWLNLLSRLLENPEDKEAARAIITNLQNTLWPAAISDEDADVIADMLGVQRVTESTDTEEIPSSADAGQYQSLLADLESACGQDTLQPGSIAEKVEALGLAAGENDLLGFQDVCLILQENLNDAVADQHAFTDPQKQALARWPVLAGRYLQSPEDRTAAGDLIRFLQDADWPYPLADDNAALLREMLGVGAEATEETGAEAPPERETSLQERIEDLSAQPHAVSTELVDMLLSETETISENVNQVAERLSSAGTEDDIKRDLLSQFLVKLDRFGNASQAAELAGLHQACAVLHGNLKLLQQENTLTPDQARLLTDWPELVNRYLKQLGQDEPCNAIAGCLTSEHWPDPLMSDVVPALVNLLSAPYVVEEDDAREERQTTATADDVSLAIPDDISQELLDGLLQELPSQTENFSAAIQSLIDGSGDNAEMEKAQRVAHTVKGAANTVGVKGIANLTHQLEDILLFLNKHSRLPSKVLSTTLMNAADCLEEMSEALLEQGSAPDNARAVLQEVLDWINRLEKEGIDILEQDLEVSSTPADTAEPAGKPAEEEETAQVPMLRVPANLIDDMIRILGETIIVTTQLQENVHRSNTESDNQFRHFNQMQALIAELDKQVELRGITFSQQQRAVNQSETTSDSDIFDPLEMEQYNELHTITNRLTEAATDSFELNRNIDHDLRELDELLFEQSRLHRQVQEIVMKTRMVPIKTITPRLQRAIRQTCRTTGKSANLVLYGTDTLVDSDVLNNLLDPLMHMLRNAIDHGIEDRETRIRNEKDPEGRIELSFSREGTQIIVRCRDDGAGLNREAIRVNAIKRGIIEPHDELPPLELDRMILLPNFSTRRETTQVSGRGIGMDVVQTQIQAIKGSIHIESEPGKGCLFELRLPVTLISSHSLLIRQRDQVLAVANRGIIQILHPSDSEIIKEGEDMQVRVGGNIYDAVNLEDLVNLPGDRRLNPRETRPALLVQEEDINRIVFMQEILDVRELVIKPMGVYMKGIMGIPGATILGDGSVVPVLDIPELLRSVGSRAYLPAGEMTGSRDMPSLPTALVVDDSLSARRSLAQVIKDAGYDVRTAKDGLDAVDIIKKKRPDILLVDLEMPRMNGMELSSHVRNNRETADVPIIMVTSRSTEKHREQARAAGVNIYLTKPFGDDELLDHVSNLLIH